jgi:hypothetical protein
MPTIPSLAEQNNQYPDSPTSTDVGPTRFGRDAAAMSALGGDIAQFGNKLITARKQAEETDAVMKTNFEDIRWRAETEEKVRQEFYINNPDGTISFNEQGFSERLRLMSEERVKGNMEKMPTGDAQRMYQARSGKMFTDAYASDLQWENVEKAKVYAQNANQVMNAATIQIGTTPNMFVLSEALENAGNWINKSTAAPVNGKQKSELYRSKGKEMTYAFFDGLSRTKKGSEYGLTILDSLGAAGGPTVKANSDDGTIQTHNMKDSTDYTYLYNFLDHKDVEHFRDKLGQKKSSADLVERNNLRSNLSDVTDKMVAGKYEPQDDVNAANYLQSLKMHVDDSKPGYTTKDFQKDHITVNVAKLSSQFMQMAASMPTNEKAKTDVKIDAIIEQAMDQTGVPQNERKQFSFQMRNEFEKKRDGLFASLVKQREADPVGYLRKYNIPGGEVDLLAVADGQPMNNGQAMAMLQAQAALGIPPSKRRLLSNEAAKALATSIKENPNPSVAGQQLLNITRGAGPSAKRYMDELVKHGKLPEKYRAATMLENQEYTKTFVDGLKNKESKNILNAQGRKEEEKKVVEESQKQFREHFGSIAGSGAYFSNTEAAMAIQENVAARARLMVSNNEATPAEAVKLAMDEMVKSSFDLRVGTLVPRQIGGQPIDGRRVEGELRWKRTTDYLNGRVDIPNGADPANEAKKLQKALGNSRWNPLPDQSGARLEIKNTKNQWIPVYGKDKQPITVDFLEADQNTSNEGLKMAPRE